MKKNQESDFKKRAARYDQQFKILINRRDFQMDMSTLRKKWNIPQKGFKRPQEHERWHRWLGEESDKWHRESWPTHRKELIRLEKTALDISNSYDYKDYLDRKNEINLENPLNAYHHDLSEMVLKYRLPPKWKEAIRAYLFTGEPKYRGFIGITVSAPIGDEGEDQIKVTLDATVTKQDLMDAWPDIKYHLDKLKHKQRSKFQPIDPMVLEKNKFAHDLKQQGETYKEIARKLSKKYPKAGGEDYGYEEVPTMIRNYKRVSGIN